MKKFNFSMILILSTIIVFACQSTKDSLDEIKSFMPDNKYFKADIVSLHFVIETSELSRVETVFNNMISKNGLPVDATGCKDGVHIGESPYDAFDYKHVVKLEIKDEKIVSVDYNEIKKGGIGKQEDEEYNEEMSTTGTSPAIAYPIMEKQLLEKQNYLNVDAVSGASYSLYRFRFAVTVALIKAILTNNS